MYIVLEFSIFTSANTQRVDLKANNDIINDVLYDIKIYFIGKPIENGSRITMQKKKNLGLIQI